MRNLDGGGGRGDDLMESAESAAALREEPAEEATFEGFGLLVDRAQGFAYAGEWRGGLRHGGGRQLWLRPHDGRVWRLHSGEWKEGLPHGVGRRWEAAPNGTAPATSAEAGPDHANRTARRSPTGGAGASVVVGVWSNGQPPPRHAFWCAANNGTVYVEGAAAEGESGCAGVLAAARRPRQLLRLLYPVQASVWHADGLYAGAVRTQGGSIFRHGQGTLHFGPSAMPVQGHATPFPEASGRAAADLRLAPRLSAHAPPPLLEALLAPLRRAPLLLQGRARRRSGQPC